MFPEQNIQSLLRFIKEREKIRVKKEIENQPYPWTNDPILREWSFCNVHREDDRVTRWVAQNWRDPNKTDPDLWFTMIVARLINWPPALAELGYPLPWSAKRFKDVLKGRLVRGEKTFSNAYIINQTAAGGAGLSKPAYLAAVVLEPLCGLNTRIFIRPKENDTLAKFHTRLTSFNGLGSFMAAQVVADMKYVVPLTTTYDWWSFAASGPGSVRGLNRMLDRPLLARWKESDWHLNLLKLREIIINDFEEIHAQDLQNCLCEFDKYERVRLGEGTPKRRYKGS